jgi:hypothetical protein
MKTRLPVLLVLPIAAALADPAPRPPPPVIVMPNADGILDLTGIGEPAGPDDTPNPFRLRSSPPAPAREARLSVRSILVGGGVPAALLNGEVLGIGETWDGMVVAAITEDTVELRQGPFLLRIPVQEEPVVIRLPR